MYCRQYRNKVTEIFRCRIQKQGIEWSHFFCGSHFYLPQFCDSWSIFCNCDYTANCTVSWRLPSSQADCVHMSAVVCGCMCGLLLQCINGAFGFSCHLCVYPFRCQSVCFCAGAYLNHCSLWMLKTKLSGAVIFSQLRPPSESGRRSKRS